MQAQLRYVKGAKNIQGAKKISSIKGAGKPDSLCKIMAKSLYLTPDTKINSQWIEDLNVILKILKLLEENTVGKLFDISVGNDFWIYTKTKGNKSRSKQVGLYRNKKPFVMQRRS